MKKIIFVIVAVAFFACDFKSEYSMCIDNQTNDTIKIVFLDKSPYKMLNPDNLFFPPMQKKLVYNTVGSSTRNGCNYTGIKEGEVMVYISSGKTLRKEIYNVNNWICSGSFHGGWKKIFIITEDDLE